MVDNAGQHTTPPSASGLSSPRNSISSLLNNELPAPGFDQIAIPWRSGVSSSSPRSLTTTATSATSSTSTSSQERRSPSRTKRTRLHEATSSGAQRTTREEAFTLLCVDDNDIVRKLLTKVCERWGQPHETAENGQQAVEMYKRNPDRYRCILMDTDMPVLSGLAAIRQIRAFEQESWASLHHKPPATTLSSSIETPPSSSSNVKAIPPSSPRMNPIRRAVVIAMAPWTTPSMVTHCVNSGFDMILQKPLHIRVMADLLFGGPATNVVSVYGAVDEQALMDAGYPLKMLPWPRGREPIADGFVSSATT